MARPFTLSQILPHIHEIPSGTLFVVLQEDKLRITPPRPATTGSTRWSPHDVVVPLSDLVAWLLELGTQGPSRCMPLPFSSFTGPSRTTFVFGEANFVRIYGLNATEASIPASDLTQYLDLVRTWILQELGLPGIEPGHEEGAS
jgi:hypothetical protein